MSEQQQTQVNYRQLILLTAMISFIIGLFAWIGVVSFIEKNPRTVTKMDTQIMYDINDPFSEQKVRDYLVQMRVRYPDVAIAQMKLESANGTSNIFRQGNNLFGLKVPYKRPTTALGTKNNHAYYSHWRQSIIDYALFCTFTMNEENTYSEQAWLRYLGKYYAEDDRYVTKLNKILVTLKRTKT